MSEEACCTCARLLSGIQPQYNEKTEKLIAQDRRLDCCGRVICGQCIVANSRFATYCPFCQVSNGPSSLPQGLRDPPAYSPLQSPKTGHPDRNTSTKSDKPPAYSALNPFAPPREYDPSEVEAEDVLHFLDPSRDTIPSLSLQYGVPYDALRRTNGLFVDHLLAARKTILIPGEYYKGGVSLSPQPLESEEEEIRKTNIRRWMVACKVADIPTYLRYDIAVLYLQQAKYDLDAAVEGYHADEKWAREHPMEGPSKGKMAQTPVRRKFGVMAGLTGQL